MDFIGEVENEVDNWWEATTMDQNSIEQEEENMKMSLEIQQWEHENEEWLVLCNLSACSLYLAYENSLYSNPCWDSPRTGYAFVQEVLNGHEKRCYQDFRMSKETFLELCSDLKNNYGLKPTRNVTTEEQVGMFLMTIGHGQGNRIIQETFQHSGETISRHFHEVLAAVLRLATDIIRPDPNYNDGAQYHVPTNNRYLPYFENCIGAIDGTHVKARLPKGKEIPYIGRKGIATQNIMAVCDFNMCFTFVWPGWEGSAHDTRIFTQALLRDELNFPHPSGDKYYVVDAGYPNTKGYLSPYIGQFIRYHLPDFQRGATKQARTPKGYKEKFNYLHSSLRNIIERTFGVWKARWAILRDMPYYSIETQRDIVIATMAIHNYIRKKCASDNGFQVAEQESYLRNATNEGNDNVDPNGSSSNNPISAPRNVAYMQRVRDAIAVSINESG